MASILLGVVAAPSTPIAAAGHLGRGDSSLATGAVIEGVVTDPSGAPVPMAGVFLQHQLIGSFVTTDASGRYRFTDLPAGTATVRVQAPWASVLADEWFEDAYALEQATVLSIGAGSTVEADVQLNVGGTVSGRVTDASGAPVAEACIELNDWGPDCFDVTDAAGRYEVRGVNPGASLVCARPPFGSPLGYGCHGGAISFGSAAPVAAALGTVAAGVDIVLDRSGVLTGSLQDSSGTPVAGLVLLYDDDFRGAPGESGPTLAQALTPDGRFSVEGLSAGRYRIVGQGFEIEGLDPPSRSVSIAPGRTTSVVLRYRGGGAVAGAPTTPLAAPGDGRVRLTWRAPGNSGDAAITDYVVQFSSNRGRSWTTFDDGVRSSTGASVTGLTNGRSYVFRVAARTAAGVGAFSESSRAATPRTLPGVPRSLTGRPGVTSVVLSWSAPSSNGGAAITDYVVQFSSNRGRSWTTFDDGVRASTGAQVTGLATGREYVFRVAARNVAGTGASTSASAPVRPR
jgi:hypothetical protein